MNNRKTQQEYRVGVGASSILMIFIVLCLTTLGVLSFASARANLTLTNRRQVKVEGYYEALAKSQGMIADIDNALYVAAQDADTYEEQVLALESLDEHIAVSSDLAISIRLPVGENQELRIELQANGPEDAQRYTIVEHYLINIEDWQPDNSLNVFI